jgi:hypothetical protein
MEAGVVSALPLSFSALIEDPHSGVGCWIMARTLLPCGLCSVGWYLYDTGGSSMPIRGKVRFIVEHSQQVVDTVR